MPKPAPHVNAPDRAGDTFLRRSGLIWYLTAAVGQAGFIWFIVRHYGRHTASGDLARWNDKSLIKGYVEGDDIGNLMFALHVLLAGIITFGGLLQLIPHIRRRLPALHRWNGRLFMVVAYFMGAGGIWLIWVRDTSLSTLFAVSATVNGVLILAFATLAWRQAMARNFESHRRWAMRLFMVVNGVWFLRVGIMAWRLLGGKGMTRDMSGPVDMVLQVGSYLFPLLILELYFLAQRSPNAVMKRFTSGVVLTVTAIMAVGIFGTIAFMWARYL